MTVLGMGTVFDAVNVAKKQAITEDMWRRYISYGDKQAQGHLLREGLGPLPLSVPALKAQERKQLREMERLKQDEKMTPHDESQTVT